MQLIGAIHWDIEGAKRLEYLLGKLHPTRVTVEWPAGRSTGEIEEEILAQRRRIVEAITEELTGVPDVVQRFFVELFSNYGYETLVPIRYAKKHNAFIFPIDHPCVIPATAAGNYSPFVKGLLHGLGGLPPEVEVLSYSRFRQMIAREMDGGYIDPSLFHQIDKHLAQRGIVGGLDHLDDPQFAEQREQFMVGEIMLHGPDIHIGGIAHACKGYFEDDSFQPLYKRLEEITFQIIKLCDAFK